MRSGPPSEFLRLPHGPVPHLNAFIEGWYRGFEACGARSIAVPWLPGRRAWVSAFCKTGLHRSFANPGRRAFAPLCWASDLDLFPMGYSRRIVPWIYDCWPSGFDRWARLLRRLRVDRAYFSSRTAASELGSRLPWLRCHWIPEAADPGSFPPGQPLVDRRIDVLEIGRRHEEFHEAITPVLGSLRRVHVYSRGPGHLLFPRPGELQAALADTRILVCHPKSVTHPELAGSLETATYRYFEAFAAGCLVVGHCPGELRDFWGFDPVVQLPASDARESLPAILDDIARFQPLVDRNRARFLEVGCWKHRAERMIALDAAD